MNAMRAAYLRRTSAHAAMDTGKPFLRFVTPADVRDLKNRIDPYVRALDENVVACVALPQGVRDGWTAFSKAWRSYFDEDDSWWHTAAQMDQAESYECDVRRWQTLLAQQKCAPDAPPLSFTNEGGSGAGSFGGTIKVVAIAAAVVAAALAIREVAK